jgi:acyl-[acyl-carrier-protein] desaturase
MSKLSHDDKMGRSVLGLIAGDEVRHFNFYRDMALAGFREDPTTMMVAARRQVEAFAMPGTGIPGFTRHAVRVSRAGIYGMDQFINGVVAPVLVAWDIEHIEGLSKDGEIARTELFAFMDSVKERVVAQSAKSERQQGESPL